MNHADFRMKQAEMDAAGMLTDIRTIRVKKEYAYQVLKNEEYVAVYRYKYKYEVILNGEIIKCCKSRRTAKNFLIEYYEAKKEFEAAETKLKRTLNKVTKMTRTIKKEVAV